MKLLDVLKKYDRALMRESTKLVKKYNELLKEAGMENDLMDDETLDVDIDVDAENASTDDVSPEEVYDDVAEFFEVNESKKTSKSKKTAKKSKSTEAKKPAKPSKKKEDDKADDKADEKGAEDEKNEKPTKKTGKDELTFEQFFETEDITEDDILKNRPHNNHHDDPDSVVVDESEDDYDEGNNPDNDEIVDPKETRMSVDPNGEGMNIHNQLLDMLQGKDKDNEKTKYEPPSAKDKDYDEDFDPDDPDYLPDEEETLDSHYRKMTDRVYNPDIDDDYEDYEIPESEKACSKFDKFFEDDDSDESLKKTDSQDKARKAPVKAKTSKAASQPSDGGVEMQPASEFFKDENTKVVPKVDECDSSDIVDEDELNEVQHPPAPVQKNDMSPRDQLLARLFPNSKDSHKNPDDEMKTVIDTSDEEEMKARRERERNYIRNPVSHYQPKTNELGQQVVGMPSRTKNSLKASRYTPYSKGELPPQFQKQYNGIRSDEIDPEVDPFFGKKVQHFSSFEDRRRDKVKKAAQAKNSYTADRDFDADTTKDFELKFKS